jgi:CRP/FNR family cyclic AMP-dependent transcriptional regulator
VGYFRELLFMVLTAKQSDVVRSDAWFGSLPAPIQDVVLARSQVLRFGAGDRLWAHGDPSDGMYCVIEGSVRLSGTSIDGEEATLSYFAPGTWAGDVPTIDGGPRIHDAYAHEPSLVLRLAPTDMEDLIREYPLFSRSLLNLMARRSRLLLLMVRSIGTQSLEERLATRFLWLASDFGESEAGGVRIGICVTQEALAQLVGTTRQRVNQILKQWTDEGILRFHRGYISLLNPAGLEILAGDRSVLEAAMLAAVMRCPALAVLSGSTCR